VENVVESEQWGFIGRKWVRNLDNKKPRAVRPGADGKSLEVMVDYSITRCVHARAGG
jgi:hypothetical protein